MLKYLCAILKVLNYYSLAPLPNFFSHSYSDNLIDFLSPTDSDYNVKKQQRMLDRTVELTAKYKKTVENNFENDAMKKVKIYHFSL